MPRRLPKSSVPAFAQPSIAAHGETPLTSARGGGTQTQRCIRQISTALRSLPFDQAGHTAAEVEATLGLPPAAASLLSIWLHARTHQSPAVRATLLESVLLAVYTGSIREASAILNDLAEDGEDHLDYGPSLIQAVGGDSVPALCAAWEAAASCPVLSGAPPLAPLREEMPISPGYRALSIEARLVVLVFAPNAGNRPMIANVDVYASRSGLTTSATRLALEDLITSRWLRREVISDIGAVLRVSPQIFAGLRDGDWGQPQ